MAGVEAGFFSRLIDERLMFPELSGTTLEEALREMAAGLARAGVVRDAEDLGRRLIERESMGSTGLGGGLAIPHIKVRDLADVVLSVGISRRGIDFRASDGIPVTLIFLVLSPLDAPALHLQALARISRVIRLPGVADGLRSASNARDIAETLRAAEKQLAVPA